MKETLGSARGRLTKTIAIHPMDRRKAMFVASARDTSAAETYHGARAREASRGGFVALRMLQAVKLEVDVIHVGAGDAHHLAVLLAHNAPRVLAHVGDSLAAVAASGTASARGWGRGAEGLSRQSPKARDVERGPRSPIAHGREVLVLKVELLEVCEVCNGSGDVADHPVVVEVEIAQPQ